MNGGKTESDGFNMANRIYLIGGAARDMTGKPSTVCRSRDTSIGTVRVRTGGVAYSIARHLAGIGITPELVTAVGTDERAMIILDDLKLHGVESSHILVSEGSSATLMQIFDEEDELLCGISDMDVIEKIDSAFLSGIINQLNSSELVVADSNLSSEALQYLADSVAVPLFYEPVSCTKANRIGANLNKVTILRSNRLEAAQLSGCSCDSLRGVYRAAEFFLAKGIRQVYISLGEDGIVYATEAEMGQIEAENVTIVDKTGAGEAMSAAIIKAILDGKSPEECARIGNHAGAMHCAGLPLV